MTEHKILSPEFRYERDSITKTGCLLIHGFTASPTETKPIGEYLARKTDWDILGIRLAGHGTSPEELAITKHVEWIASAEKGYERLSERNDRVFIIGLSMGSLLTTLLANRKKVAGIALLSPPFKLKSKLASLAPVLKHFIPKTNKSPETIATLKKHGFFSYGERPLAAVAEFNKLMKTARPLLKKIGLPVIAVYSTADDLIDWRHFKDQFPDIPSKKKKMIELEHVDHIITLHTEIDWVYGEILDFFTRNGH